MHRYSRQFSAILSLTVLLALAVTRATSQERRYTFTTVDCPFASPDTGLICLTDSGILYGGYAVEPVEGGASTNHGFVLDDGRFTTLDNPLAGGTLWHGTNLNAANDRGVIVGSYTDVNSLYHGFVYERGVFTTLDDPLGAPTYTILENYDLSGPFGINNAGVIVGNYFDSNGATHGYIYKHGVFTTLDVPSAGAGAGQGTFPLWINSHGVISGWYTDALDASHGFIYEHGKFTQIDYPLAGSGNTYVYINDAGMIAGGYGDASGTYHAFVLKHGKFKTVDPPFAFSELFVNSLSNTGQLIGLYVAGIPGLTPGHGFIASPTHPGQ